MADLVTLPPVPTLADYLALIPAEHQNQPIFQTFITPFLQGQIDNQNILRSLQSRFDLDDTINCVGFWLDQVGARVGQSRQINVALTNVYFSWGIAGLGWGEGTWFATGDATSGLVVLPDDSYRQLIKAVIAANQWDGTVPGAYAVWAIAFGPNQIALKDNQDRSMTIIWIGPPPNAVTLALIATGHLALKPAGVRITGYFLSTVQGNPNAPLTQIGDGF